MEVEASDLKSASDFHGFLNPSAKIDPVPESSNRLSEKSRFFSAR